MSETPAAPALPLSPSLNPALSPSLIMANKRPRVALRPHIHHGDCVAGMKEMENSSVRLVVADPPYGIGVKGAVWDGGDGYMGFARAWLAEAVRVLQPGGTLLFFSSPCTIWASRMNVELEDALGMKHQQTLTWTYTQGGDARMDSMKQYAVRSETIEWWIKTPGMPTFHPELAAERYTDEDKKIALSKGVGRVTETSLDKGRPPRTWCSIPRENSRSSERKYGKHPAIKPLMLCERLIGVHSSGADRVLVPFAGSGSEVLTAAKLGREVVAFETEVDYIAMMKARMAGHAVDVEFS